MAATTRSTFHSLESENRTTVTTNTAVNYSGPALEVKVVTTEIATGKALSKTSNPQAINPARLAKLEDKPTKKSQVAGNTANQARAPPIENILPLEQVTNPTVPTNAAAYYLNRRPQTLRLWACFEDGPIRPIRIYGRLAWSVALIRELLGVA